MGRGGVPRGEVVRGEARARKSKQQNTHKDTCGKARYGGAWLVVAMRGMVRILLNRFMVGHETARCAPVWCGPARYGFFKRKHEAMRFELQVDEIKPGDVIEQSQCEVLIGFSRSSDKYAFQFQLMRLADFIATSLRKIGREYTVTTREGSVCILTHEQASRYNVSKFAAGLRKSRRSFRRLLAVDTSALTVEAKTEHGENLVKQSRVLQAISSRSKDLDLIPVVRTTPKMLQGA